PVEEGRGSEQLERSTVRLPELHGEGTPAEGLGSREEKDLYAHAALLRVRSIRGIAVIALAGFLLLGAGAQSADAKVAKGPAGLKFYKPPKHLPKQHGTLIWARKAGG